ncbi:hypothetical protein CRG98_028228 [Punica granatum]|uniref:Uncharacterized protein n=1 Tax=Punica granatum TaxID=22663 RepID=A0A2I0J557_PUNGR|nr:hypothetical protein CRG98_028228 [Punica granatum]
MRKYPTFSEISNSTARLSLSRSRHSFLFSPDRLCPNSAAASSRTGLLFVQSDLKLRGKSALNSNPKSGPAEGESTAELRPIVFVLFLTVSA